MRNPDDPIASTDNPPSGREPGERSFYGRWSRRKRQARDGVVPVEEREVAGLTESAPRAASLPATAGEASVADGTEAADEPVLTDADMPPLESLGADDDYSGFMSPGVSEGLRNQALRKLFMSSQFNVLDGLNDYDDDFRSFEALGDIITSDMRHQMEMQAERAKREAEEKARALLADESRGEPAVVEDAQSDPSDLEAEDAHGCDGAAHGTLQADVSERIEDESEIAEGESPEETRDV